MECDNFADNRDGVKCNPLSHGGQVMDLEYVRHEDWCTAHL